jgi:hypothetical protein
MPCNQETPCLPQQEIAFGSPSLSIKQGMVGIVREAC